MSPSQLWKSKPRIGWVASLVDSVVRFPKYGVAAYYNLAKTGDHRIALSVAGAVEGFSALLLIYP